ncbi:MAG: hypothetical protein R3E95_04620 [Thiolinea sp.]
MKQQAIHARYWAASVLATSLLILSGCNNSDGEDINRLEQLANQTADSESLEIYDPDGLEQDIRDRFGNADDEPLAVNQGDTVETLLNRH